MRRSLSSSFKLVRSVVSSALFALPLALVVACGGGSSGSAQELCNKSIEANCEKIFTCAEGEPVRADVGGTKAKCIADMGIFCAAGSSSTCQTAGETYHADKAQQCLDETKAATCAASFDSSGFLMTPESCMQVCS